MFQQGDNPGRRCRLSPRAMAGLSQELYLRFSLDMMADGFKAGDVLPGEKELSARYRAPLSVVRGMFRRLCDEGMAEAVRYKGVFLRKAPDGNSTTKASGQFLRLALVAFLQVEHPNAKHNRTSGVLRWFDFHSSRNKCQTKLFNTHPGYSVELELLEELKAYHPDGILYLPELLAPEGIKDSVRKLKILGVPLVEINFEPSGLCAAVNFDQERLVGVAVEALVKHGHREIAFLQLGGDELWRAERLSGYRKALESHGIPFDGALCFDLGEMEPTHDNLKAPVRAVFPALRNRCSAAMCSGDIIAAELIAAAAERGVRAPEDLSVVGVDDDVRVRHLDITTMPQSGYELGEGAFALLSEMIKFPSDKPIIRKVTGSLLMRSTLAENRREAGRPARFTKHTDCAGQPK